MTRLDLDIQLVRTQVERLISENPELADDETLRVDMLEGATDLLGVLDRIVSIMRAKETLSAAIKEREIALGERRQKLERGVKSMRAMAQQLMEDAQVTKPLQLAEATLSLRPVPPSAIITDETMLPEAFWRVKREPNKSAIAQELRNGGRVPGATLGNGGTTLMVRI